MPATHVTELFDVNDFHVWKLTADDAASSPVYGTAVDVPGIQEIGLDPNLVSAVLKGDARTLRRQSKVDEFQVTANYAELSIDANAVFLGGDVADPDANTAQWSYHSGSRIGYFKAQFVILDVDPTLDGIVIVLYKCQVTGGTLLNPKTDDFGTPSIQFSAIEPDGSAPTLDVFAYTLGSMPPEITALL